MAVGKRHTRSSGSGLLAPSRSVHSEVDVAPSSAYARLRLHVPSSRMQVIQKKQKFLQITTAWLLIHTSQLQHIYM